MAQFDVTFIRKQFTFKASDDDGTTKQAFPTPQLNISTSAFDILSTTVEINNKTKEGLTNATAVFILLEK